MITKITAQNKSAYDIFFTKVSEALGLTEKITSLDQYFQHLDDIREKGRDDLLIVPADEEYFSVDANTRKITIPAIFAKNGVGVQGDTYVEYLYFQIDRYFENVDFGANNVQAIVEWENADKEQYYSIAWTQFVETGEDGNDKVIIGWPITGNLTKKAGQIRFAVRLYEVDADGTLSRNFATLISQLTVNPTLNFNLPDVKVDNVNPTTLAKLDVANIREVMSRKIKSSPPSSGEVLYAPQPRFLYRYTQEGYAPEIIVDVNKGTLDATGKFTPVNVQACSDNGSISYIWRYSADNDKEPWEDIGKKNGTSIDSIFEKIQNFSDIQPGDMVYCQSGSGYIIAKTPATAEEFGERSYYQKYSQLQLAKDKDVVGYYKCIAQNDYRGAVSRSDGLNRDSSNEPVPKTESSLEESQRIGIVKVPGPQAIEVTTKLSGTKQLNETPLTIAVAASSEKNDIDSYSWSFAAPGAEASAIAEAKEASYQPTVEGTYSAEVSRSRNGRVNKADCGSIEVYEPAKAVTFNSQDNIYTSADSIDILFVPQGQNEKYSGKLFNTSLKSDVEGVVTIKDTTATINLSNLDTQQIYQLVITSTKTFGDPNSTAEATYAGEIRRRNSI